MIRRLLAASVLAAAFTLSVGGSAAHAATTQQTFLTFYGWYDNTPPGGDIAYPQIHSTAGGKGTFADPITFATSRRRSRRHQYGCRACTSTSSWRTRARGEVTGAAS
jgi:hypothetical protein